MSPKRTQPRRTITASRQRARSHRPRHSNRSTAGKNRDIDAARQISEALFDHLDRDALIEKAMITALDVVGAESGSVLLADPASKQLIFTQSAGLTHVEPGTTMPWDKGIAGSVFQSGKPIMIKNVRKEKRHYGAIDAQLAHVTRDMVVLPLKRWRGEPIGVLEVLNKTKGTFTRGDLDLLTIVSAVAASAIERARLYEEAKLAEVVRFLGGLSHDVKNLLMPVTLGADVIRGYVQRLHAKVLPEQKSEADEVLARSLNALKMFRLSNKRIQDLMKDIANCVKGAATEPDFAPCRLASVIEQVFETLEWLAGEKGIELNTRGLEELPEIVADERRLFNAFYNLVNNALAEVPRGGNITVSGGLDDSRTEVVITVSDTGPGIPRDVQERILSGHASSRKRGGTGLGMRIVKDVLDAHAGRISITSEVHQGTTFVLHLPLR